MNTDIQLSDIQAAAERIRPIAHRTPVLTSRSFDDVAGTDVFFKCENFQRGGAFKIRGAANFVYSIPKDRLSRGVVAYSSGRSEEHTSELQSRQYLVCRLLLEKKKNIQIICDLMCERKLNRIYY